MSDRVERIRQSVAIGAPYYTYGVSWIEDLEWLIAEIDRLRANEDSLCEKIRALTDENKRLRAKQIPGRCGECRHFEGRDEVSHGVCGYLKCKTEGCTKLYVQWIKNKKDFCNEWKPKE